MAGTYQLLKNGKARLQYMYKGERYSQTIFAKNSKEASVKLAEFVTTIQKAENLKSNCTYLELAQKYLDDYVRVYLAEETQYTYKNILNNRILPYFGKYKLEDITPSLISEFFAEARNWKTNYKSRKNEHISREFLSKVYNILSGSLQKAFEWDMLSSNPCRKIPKKALKLDTIKSEIEKIKIGNDKIKAYNLETYKKVLELLDNNNNFEDKDRAKKVCAELILKTGLCLEELAGLEWKRDYNQEKQTLSVNIVQVYIRKKGWIQKKPKEKERTRTISLSDSTNELLLKFREEHKKEKYIFFNLINFSTYTNWLKNWQIKNNISPVLTAHQLRHTHATLLLQANVPTKYISKRLGHSSTAMTEEVYIEYLPEHNSFTADVVDTL